MTPTILCRVLWPTYLPRGITKEVSLANLWYTELTIFHIVSHYEFFQLIYSVVVAVWGPFLQLYSWQGSSSLAKVQVLQVKDLGLALAAAEESGAATPLGMEVLQMWVDLVWRCLCFGPVWDFSWIQTPQSFLSDRTLNEVYLLIAITASHVSICVKGLGSWLLRGTRFYTKY